MSKAQSQAQAQSQSQPQATQQDKKQRSSENKELIGQNKGFLDQRLDQFEDFYVPQKGAYKEVRNEVYVNYSIDKDGKQKYERTFDRSVAHAQDGKLIAERRQRYEDDSGMKKETHEKQLDTKGVKQISERNEKGEWQTNYQKRNIDNTDQFNDEWIQRNQDLTNPLQLKMWDHFPALL